MVTFWSRNHHFFFQVYIWISFIWSKLSLWCSGRHSYTFVYMCIYIYMHTHIHIYTYIYTYIHSYIYIYIHSPFFMTLCSNLLLRCMLDCMYFQPKIDIEDGFSTAFSEKFSQSYWAVSQVTVLSKVPE